MIKKHPNGYHTVYLGFYEIIQYKFINVGYVTEQTTWKAPAKTYTILAVFGAEIL